MAEQQPKPGKPSDEPPPDEWGTTTRVGYEDRPFYQPRKAAPARKGSRPLRMVGALLVVAGIAWVTYVATSPEGINAVLKPGLALRPVIVLAAGLLILILEKLVR
jgi:hypothetical protein